MVAEKSTRSEYVTLAHLALACLMFNSLTSYNESLSRLHRKTGSQVDLADNDHRRALLKWLNDWGCRHLSVAQHDVASDSIQSWNQSSTAALDSIVSPVWKLSSEEITAAATAYAALKHLPGALRERKGKSFMNPIGPTAASKVLFALKPASLPPWDESMRKHFGCDGSPESYEKFVRIVREMSIGVVSQCDRNGFSIARLPSELGRPNATVLSLLNEYLWVSISAGARLPHRFTLARWAEW